MLGTVRLQVPGLHNVRDSLGALAASLYCGIPFEKQRRPFPISMASNGALKRN